MCGSYPALCDRPSKWIELRVRRKFHAMHSRTLMVERWDQHFPNRSSTSCLSRSSWTGPRHVAKWWQWISIHYNGAAKRVIQLGNLHVSRQLRSFAEASKIHLGGISSNQ